MSLVFLYLLNIYFRRLMLYWSFNIFDNLVSNLVGFIFLIYFLFIKFKKRNKLLVSLIILKFLKLFEKSILSI